MPNEVTGANNGLFAKCDELERFRSTGELADVHTIGVATGLQKDKYDSSGNAGIVYVRAFLCAMIAKDVSEKEKMPIADRSGRIAAAFKRVEAGEVAALPALDPVALGCFSAWLAPA